EMKVTRFREIMTLLAPAVPKKPTLKALACICVKDKQMVATNLETFITVDVPEADGEFLIPFAQVNKMIQYTNGSETSKYRASVVKLPWRGQRANTPSRPKTSPTSRRYRLSSRPSRSS
ncbi:hypothetical protein LCGC14_2890290, partial [marine sediment metagenome]